MSFILIPNKGGDVQVNAWHWRPTLEFLRAEDIITTEAAELLGSNGCGACVDADLASRIAGAVEIKLSTMKPGDRMRADLTVTDIPTVAQIFRPDNQPGDIDAINLYSATYEWLLTFKVSVNDAAALWFRSAFLRARPTNRWTGARVALFSTNFIGR